MNFHSPHLLYLILFVPLLIWLRKRLQRKQTMRFSDGLPLEGLPKSWRIRMQPILPALYALGLVALIVALARPQIGLDKNRVHTEAVDIILLVDLSTSMQERDFRKVRSRLSRIDAAKEVMFRFLENRPDDRVGMVAFAALPYAVAPLTLDHSWLQLRMESIYAGMLPDGTAIGDGMMSAINRLQESDAKSKVIILLTDGANTAGKMSPEGAANVAAAIGVKVYTIGVGGAGAGYRSRRGQVDVETLTKIANLTDAKFYRARDLQTLGSVYEEIDQLEKTEIEVEQFTRYEEAFMPWALAGLALLALEQLLGLTKLGRLP